MTEQAKITVRDNGPYLVKGPVLLLDAEGNEFRVERATVGVVPLRGLDDEAILRRYAFEDWVPCGAEGGTRGS